MRIVVDTNVFVGAALKQSSWPGHVVRWVDKFGGLLKTESTEQELFEVVQRTRIARIISPLFVEKLRLIFSVAEMVPVLEKVTGCRDPKDDKFLELAVNGRAELIISGDVDLLVLDSFREIPIVTPAAFYHMRLV